MIQISAGALIYCALLLLVLPLKWLLSVLLAAVVHEGGHILALFLLQGDVQRIQIGCFGAEITGYASGMPAHILSILAGPASSLLLLFFAESCPELAVCGLVQGLFNLLPLFPLDGGRILRIALDRILPEKRLFMERGIAVCFLIFLIFVWRNWGTVYDIPLFSAVLLVLLRKTPCKRTRIRVQ